jgi:hypothetical protein
MAKVMVFEDAQVDLIKRYGGLSSEHEVHVQWYGDELDDSEIERLAREGFEPEKIYQSHPSIRSWKSDPPKADVYFVDGLRSGGLGLLLMRTLPKERTFLNSDHRGTIEDVLAEGYQVLRTSPEEAIRQVMER